MWGGALEPKPNGPAESRAPGPPKHVKELPTPQISLGDMQAEFQLLRFREMMRIHYVRAKMPVVAVASIALRRTRGATRKRFWVL